MSDKIWIDNKLTQHVLDPSEDSHSYQLTTMGARWCHAEGVSIGLTTAMPRDTLNYNKCYVIMSYMMIMTCV